VSIGTKKSNDAYQSADENAEKILNQIRTMSNSAEIINNINITELCNALLPANFCADNDVKFFNAKGDEITDNTISIKYIKRFSLNSNSTTTIERAVSVPVTSRVYSPYVFNMPKRCDATIEGYYTTICSAAIIAACGANCQKVSFFYGKEDGLDDSKVTNFSVILNTGTLYRKPFPVQRNTDLMDMANCTTEGACHLYLRNSEFASYGVPALLNQFIYLRAESNNNYYIDSPEVRLFISPLSATIPCTCSYGATWSTCTNPDNGDGMQTRTVTYSPVGCSGGAFCQFGEQPCP